MDERLVSYQYLWKDPNSFALVAPNDQNPDYSVIKRFPFSNIWIEDMEIHNAVVQKLLEAGVQVISEEEFFEIRVQDNKDLWEDNKRYVLVRINHPTIPSYIQDVQKGGTERIEDENLFRVVVKRMIEAGVRVVDQEEADRLLREARSQRHG